jgi:hypothetical protein
VYRADCRKQLPRKVIVGPQDRGILLENEDTARKCAPPLDLNHGPLATYFEHLAHEDTAKSRAILVEGDQVPDALGLDEKVLDALLAKLGLE